MATTLALTIDVFAVKVTSDTLFTVRRRGAIECALGLSKFHSLLPALNKLSKNMILCVFRNLTLCQKRMKFCRVKDIHNKFLAMSRYKRMSV